MGEILLKGLHRSFSEDVLGTGWGRSQPGGFHPFVDGPSAVHYPRSMCGRLQRIASPTQALRPTPVDYELSDNRLPGVHLSYAGVTHA